MKSMENINEKQVKTVFFTTVLISILLGFITIVTYNSIQMIKERQFETEWSYIVGVLNENQDKASIQANYVKENVIRDINIKYTDKLKLKADIDNLTIDNDLSLIFDNNLKDKYLNVKNDNNDMFVISTWQPNENIDLQGKIIYDKSINCMANGEIRTFDKELSEHYNYNLGYDGVKRTLTQNKEKPIIWEYLKSNNPKHIKLDYGSLEGLKEVYRAEGIEGLKTYEVLVPVYVKDDVDLLGNPKVTNSGTYNQDNRQVIIVQGFSLYDALMTNHNSSLISNKKTFEFDLKSAFTWGGFGIILTIVILTSIIKIQNLAAEIEELSLDLDD